VKSLRRAFGGASIAWAAALPIATFIAWRPDVSVGSYLLGFGVYVIGSLVCHQRPERSFYIWGHQMPVCARCTGIYAGAAFVAMMLPLASRLGSAAPTFASVSGWLSLSRKASVERRSLRGGDRLGVGRSPKGFALAALAPTIATLAYEWTTGVMPANWIRAASGLWLGAGLAILVAGLAESPREVN